MQEPYKQQSYAPMPIDLRTAMALEEIDTSIKLLVLVLSAIAVILFTK